MNRLLKQEVHALIDKCEDVVLLNQAKQLLQVEKDWWDELTKDDKSLVMESKVEHNKGNFVSQLDLMKQFEEWNNK